MKKLQVIGVTVALLVLGIAGCAQASEIGKEWKFGVGFESMYAGSLLNGLSARAWTGPLGMEVDLFQGSAKAKVDVADSTVEARANMWAAELKGMYAFVEKKNSKFYAGANVNYAGFSGKVDLPDSEDGGKIDGSYMWTFGPFIGSEFNFDALPELGLNFEVGYMFNNSQIKVVSNDPTANEIKAKIDLYGINLALGVHYYF
jgi:outer membrane protein W